MAPRVRFVYSGIRVRDLARSVRFYRRMGFRVVHRGSFHHGGRYVHLEYPGSPHRLELNFYPKGSRFYEPFGREPPFDHFGFFAEDPDDWLRRARRAGARFTVGYPDRPAQQLYFVTDPDGFWIGVYGPRPGPSERPRRARGPARPLRPKPRTPRRRPRPRQRAVA
ncbi:MAG TPA: VOC family protein [Thermoplasmata archaeon]|nr:VOC family protein [Thermoplasmata archaeon]